MKNAKMFFTIQLPDKTTIRIPKPTDPIKGLQEWGEGANLKNLSPSDIRKLVEEQAYKEILKGKKKKQGR